MQKVKVRDFTKFRFSWDKPKFANPGLASTKLVTMAYNLILMRVWDNRTMDTCHTSALMTWQKGNVSMMGAKGFQGFPWPQNLLSKSRVFTKWWCLFGKWVLIQNHAALARSPVFGHDPPPNTHTSILHDGVSIVPTMSSRASSKSAEQPESTRRSKKKMEKAHAAEEEEEFLFCFIPPKFSCSIILAPPEINGMEHTSLKIFCFHFTPPISGWFCFPPPMEWKFSGQISHSTNDTPNGTQHRCCLPMMLFIFLNCWLHQRVRKCPTVPYQHFKAQSWKKSGKYLFCTTTKETQPKMMHPAHSQLSNALRATSPFNPAKLGPGIKRKSTIEPAKLGLIVGLLAIFCGSVMST